MLEIRHKSLHDGVSIKDAYDAFYQKTELQMRDSFYLWLIDLLGLRPGELLLDVACGQGRLVQLAAQRGIQALGLDLSFEGMVKGARHAPAARWMVGDGMRIPLPDASMDYIMNIGSLEHYDNPIQGMREIARLLKPNGRACILLPNAFGLWGNIKRVWQTGEIFDDKQPLQRYATRNTWETALRFGGLTVERLVPWNETNFPRTAHDLLWTAQRPQKIIRAGLAAFLPANLANHFVFICRKASTAPAQTYYPMWPAP